SWNGTAPLTYSYRWQRCDSSGCVDVGSNAATYTPTSADAGATIRVIVTATTITVNARPGDDGDVTVNNMAVPGAAYPPAGTPNPADKTQNLGVRRAFAFGGYEVRTALLRFRASLPAGATITSATLRLYVLSRQSNDNRKLVAEWLNGNAVWPLSSADYTATPA